MGSHVRGSNSASHKMVDSMTFASLEAESCSLVVTCVGWHPRMVADTKISSVRKISPGLKRLSEHALDAGRLDRQRRLGQVAVGRAGHGVTGG